MEIVYRALAPERIEIVMTITMPLSDWKKLDEQLNEAFPSWKLSKMIRQLARQAEQHFKLTGSIDD